MRGVIQTRLNRLDEASHQVLETAAVFRQQFYFTTVKRACDKSADEALDALDRLLRAQLIKEVEVGEVIEAQTTNPGSLTDFPAWAKTSGNEIVKTDQEDKLIKFFIKRLV